MGKNLVAFWRQLGRGIRPNRYEVIITPPDELIRQLSGEIDIERMTLLCKSVTFPGKTWDTHVINPTGSRTVELPSVLGYQDVVMTFYEDSHGKTHKFFEYWVSMVEDQDTGKLHYLNEYAGIIDVYKLDKNGNRIYGVKLFEAWPKDISSEELTYDSNNEISSFNLTISYDSFDVIHGGRHDR